MVFVSGCLGMDPTTKKIVEGGVVTETRRVLENMKAVLESAGSSLVNTNTWAFFVYLPFWGMSKIPPKPAYTHSRVKHLFPQQSKVVKTTILLKDIESFGEVNYIYAQYFPSEPPARATYAVAALPLGGLVEIECIALA
mmetsp:Transcript_17805/g.25344  ORF Transcript_17805/g.25344 Transcript_17805/m.25344 type:complete len:139 (+) Transcript_17805:127-543(+)